MNHNLRHCEWPIPGKGGERTTVLHRRWVEGGKGESYMGAEGKGEPCPVLFCVGQKLRFSGKCCFKRSLSVRSSLLRSATSIVASSVRAYRFCKDAEGGRKLRKNSSEG